MKKHLPLVCAALALFSPGSAEAAIEAVSPVGGLAVRLLPDIQREVMALPTLKERLDFLASAPKSYTSSSAPWRVSRDLVLEIRATGGEKGPWKVQIGKSPDLGDARTWFIPPSKSSGKDIAITVPMANLEIGARYHWKVSWRGRCGFGCGPGHGCAKCTNTCETAVCDFVTEDLAPRWIAIEGRVKNIRDLGGRKGLGGRRVRQNMAFRGQGLNDNSETGETKGANRLTVEDVGYFTRVLGIKTDLDLRGPGETADLAESPLGPGVGLIIRSSSYYKGIFKPDGMKTMAENFRVFCDRSNYPVYFHCIGGADRTGALAYVLNGVLGVDRHELETDWESTFYPKIPDANPDPAFWRRESHLTDGFAKYGDAGTSWSDRIVLYLKDCGITDAEIDTFRAIMLEQ